MSSRILKNILICLGLMMATSAIAAGALVALRAPPQSDAVNQDTLNVIYQLQKPVL